MGVISTVSGVICIGGIILILYYVREIEAWIELVFIWSLSAGTALVALYFLVVFTSVIWIQFKRIDH